MRTVVIDTETNALKGYTKCHVLVCRDVDTDEVATFRHIHLYPDAARNYFDNVECIIGHNLLGFDCGVLESYLGRDVLKDKQLYDTLILSRLFNYNQEGGHSLEAWGNRFHFPKDLFSDFSKWSKELEQRCIVDTLLTKRLYIFFRKYLENPKWKKPIELEHKVATLCNTLNTNGFSFNITLAKHLYEEILAKVTTLRDSFREAFPPKSKLVRYIVPSSTKSGSLKLKDFRWHDSTDLSAFSADAPFSLFEYEEFNPNSPVQIVQRLNEAGWKPTNKTKGHILAERNKDKEKLAVYKKTGWKVDEENLATLPDDAPEAARKLAEYLLLNSRLGDLTEWISLYNPATGRIHGTFNGMGSWTHRKSHNSPNMANIPALVNRHGKPQPYGPEFRSLWCAPEGKVLVGCDAEGIQLRLFAHFCNDLKLIKAIVEGKKEDKTDIHSLNKQVLDTICNSREVAKTYIYALLLGAATAKQSEILGCSPREAEAGLQRILSYYPGWKVLKETKLKKDGLRGYFEGLDGRLVIVPDAHRVLAGYLQNGESVVMKMASLLWTRQLDDKKIPYWFVNDVHDEWQTETYPEYAETVGQLQAESIRIVGEELNLNCPLAGKYVVGQNWKETH